MNTTEFIARSVKIHGNAYTYDNTTYVDRFTHVDITCPIHGAFSVTPSIHLHRKIGCGKCGKIKASTKRRMGTHEFVERAKKIIGEHYDFSQVKYVNNSTKVEIGCPKHGTFHITPRCVVNLNQGCRQCGVEKSAKSRSMSYDEFVKLAQHIHGSAYDYTTTVVSNSLTKVEIVCPRHGLFNMLPGNHIHGEQGCRRCVQQDSRAERKIATILQSHNIDYFREHTFSDLRGLRGGLLRFDFFIPAYNCLIEYDGEQHFSPVFGPYSFERCQTHDKIKTAYATEKGIRLVRIPFSDYPKLSEVVNNLIETMNQQVRYPNAH